MWGGVSAIAASLIVAVLLWQGSTVTFAAVQQQIRVARSMHFRMNLVADNGASPSILIATESWLDTRIGVRTDASLLGATLMQISKRWERPAIVLDHLNRSIVHLPATEDEHHLFMAFDPVALLSGLRDHLGDRVELLGRRTGDDGRTVRGFGVDGASLGLSNRSRVELWVDPATRLPVRIDYRLPLPDGRGVVSLVADAFRWNEPYEATLIALPIPPDYAVRDALVVPEASEEALVNALRGVAGLTGGTYPGHRDSHEALGTLMAGVYLQTSGASPMSADRRAVVNNLLAGALFYLDLLHDGRQPQYFGATVDAHQPDAILMQWRPKDGHQRIIRGDLRVETRPSGESSTSADHLP